MKGGRKKGGGACRLYFDATHLPTCNYPVMSIRKLELSNSDVFFTLECIGFNNIHVHMGIFGRISQQSAT